MAALSYVWLLSVVMIILKRRDEFVLFHAKQGVALFLVSLVAMVAAVSFFPAGAVLWCTVVVLEVVGFFKALGGEWFKLPLIGKIT